MTTRSLQYDNIPEELKGVAQWVRWKQAIKDGRPAKIPFDCNGGHAAATDNPETWGEYEQAKKAYENSSDYAGIGFVFSHDDDYCGVDLDDCIDDESNVVPEAQEIVDRFDTYSEVSPSGRGVKLFFRGTLPTPTGKHVSAKTFKSIEAYDHGRFFTITGNHLAGTPTTIEDRQEAIDWLTRTYLDPEPEPKPAPACPAAPKKRTGKKPKPTPAERCLAYLKTVEDAISGSGGHTATLRAACECYRFGLSDSEAMDCMRWFNRNKTGKEQWTEKELLHKLQDAKKLVTAEGNIGYHLRNDRQDEDEASHKQASVCVSVTEKDTCYSIIDLPQPLRLAEHVIDAHHRTLDGTLTRRRHRSSFWDYRAPRYVEVTDETVDAELYAHLDRLWTPKRDKQGQTEPDGVGKVKFTRLVPKSGLVREVRVAMPSRGLLVDERTEPPVWLDGHDGPNPKSIVPFTNGLLDLETRELHPLTPKLFCLNGLVYGYNPDAPAPKHWKQFLNDLWPGDEQSVQTIQEWFGYTLAPWTALQKMLLLVGPKRSGKGTIGRVLTAMLGAHNVAGPTLASMAQNFGLSPLLGKLLAIISDARLSGRTDHAIVTERLLSISGEDALDVDRKHKDPVTVKLPTRIMLLTNELPRLSDSSGALASRFIVLTLKESFYGREDHELTNKLLLELPGILLWAMDGWERLKNRGRFEQPASSGEAIQALEDLGSPMGAFIRECCEVKTGRTCEVDVMYNAWCSWCADAGRDKPGTKQVFGRDLSAVEPGIRVKNAGKDGDRHRVYEGIGLTEHGTVLGSRTRAYAY